MAEQTLCELELIVADDGSTDETPDLVARLAARDRRIRYLRQENQGLAAARNLGLAEARGTWVAFLDDDDLWHERMLESSLAACDETTLAVGCHCVRFWSESSDLSAAEVLGDPEKFRVGPWPEIRRSSPLTPGSRTPTAA